MNPLTLDFIRRWKWLLVAQFILTALAWVSHATQPKARLHLEVFVAVAMSWDLIRGLVRAQLGLPQRREAIAAGLWLSVVGLGAVTHGSAMLLGGAVLAPLLGQEMNLGVLGLHFVISLILIGGVQFILTGLPSSPPRTLAARVKGTIFGGLWGLPMFGSFWIAFFAPADWREVTAVHGGMMVLLGVMAVASWFTTRSMMMERATPNQNAAPPESSGDWRARSSGLSGWRVWVIQEGRWFLPVVGMVLLAATFMISIKRASTTPGGLPDRALISSQLHSMGMLCGMILFPLLGVSAGTLRACRGFPAGLGKWAVLMTFRPFAGGLLVIGFYTPVAWVMGRSAGMEGRMLLAFLPLCSVMSIVQAVMLRHPRMLVMFPLLMFVPIFGGEFCEWYFFADTDPVVTLSLTGGLMVLSGLLHWRWLGNSSQVYRLNPEVLRRISGGAQR